MQLRIRALSHARNVQSNVEIVTTWTKILFCRYGIQRIGAAYASKFDLEPVQFF